MGITRTCGEEDCPRVIGEPKRARTRREKYRPRIESESRLWGISG
jgi:hypothetical protein